MAGRAETAASTQPGGVRTLMPRPLSSHTTSSGSGSRWYAQYPAVLSAPTAVEWLIEASPRLATTIASAGPRLAGARPAGRARAEAGPTPPGPSGAGVEGLRVKWKAAAPQTLWR